MAALSFLAAFLVVGFICECFAPAFAIPYPPLINFGIVLIARELVQDFVTLARISAEASFALAACATSIARRPGRAIIMLRTV